MKIYLPDADRVTQWFGDTYPGAPMSTNKGCIHTTETIFWPGYEGGATAPNVTAMPDAKNQSLRYRQHFRLDRSARALQNRSGGVETNTEDVFQIELVGTCSGATRDKWVRQGYVQNKDFIYWPEAPDWALRALAKLVMWFDDEGIIEAASPIEGRWTAYPDSYGTNALQRLTGSVWLAVRGWVGHQHVPENDHGDPGALRFGRVLDFVAEQKDWFDMATKDDLRAVLSEQITADNPAFVNAVRVAIEAERAEDAAAVWEVDLTHPNGTTAKAKTWLVYANSKIDGLKAWLVSKMGA